MSKESHYTIDLKRLKIGTHEFEVTLDDGFFKELEKIGFEKDRIKLNVSYYKGNAEISYQTTYVDNNELLELEEIARK